MDFLKPQFSISSFFTLITFCFLLLAFYQQVKQTREIGELKKRTLVLRNDRDVCVRLLDLFTSLDMDNESDARLFSYLKNNAGRFAYWSDQLHSVEYYGNPTVLRLDESMSGSLAVLTFNNSLPAILFNQAGVVDIRDAFYTDYGSQKVNFVHLDDDRIPVMTVKSAHGNFGQTLTHDFTISKQGFELIAPKTESNQIPPKEDLSAE